MSLSTEEKSLIPEASILCSLRMQLFTHPSIRSHIQTNRESGSQRATSIRLAKRRERHISLPHKCNACSTRCKFYFHQSPVNDAEWLRLENGISARKWSTGAVTFSFMCCILAIGVYQGWWDERSVFRHNFWYSLCLFQREQVVTNIDEWEKSAHHSLVTTELQRFNKRLFFPFSETRAERKSCRDISPSNPAWKESRLWRQHDTWP